MKNITFSDDAFTQYMYWQVQNKKTLNRINALLMEIGRGNPFTGTGKPEPLKHDKDGLWSRRIDDTNRLVFSVIDQAITIYQCRGHYRPVDKAPQKADQRRIVSIE